MDIRSDELVIGEEIFHRKKYKAADIECIRFENKIFEGQLVLKTGKKVKFKYDVADDKKIFEFIFRNHINFEHDYLYDGAVVYSEIEAREVAQAGINEFINYYQPIITNRFGEGFEVVVKDKFLEYRGRLVAEYWIEHNGIKIKDANGSIERYGYIDVIDLMYLLKYNAATNEAVYTKQIDFALDPEWYNYCEFDFVDGKYEIN